MLSIAVIFLSVLLAGASPARRAPCTPILLGSNSNITITNGFVEAGFSSNTQTLVSQPRSLDVTEFAVATSNITGPFQLLKATNEELALTNTGGLPEMLPVGSTIFDPRTQSWVIQCSSCVILGDRIGQGCSVMSLIDEQCLNISDSVGSSVTVGNCEAIGSSIDIYNGCFACL